MKVVAPADYAHVVALDGPVTAGAEVTVTDEVGAALIEQGWTEPKAPTTTKREIV